MLSLNAEIKKAQDIEHRIGREASIEHQQETCNAARAVADVLPYYSSNLARIEQDHIQISIGLTVAMQHGSRQRILRATSRSASKKFKSTLNITLIFAT